MMKGGGGTTSMRTSWTMSVRRSGYKAVLDGVGGRRRREDDMVEIRKAKKEESLLKKRRESLPHSPSAVSLDQKLISRIWSDKRDLLIEATTQIRTLLCGEMFNLHVEEVIQAGLVPRFVEFLTWDDFPQLQFEAAWAITNIASGTSENTEVVIDHGAVAMLVRLLSSPYDGVREQVVWALGNISGDSPRCRDIVLGHAALPSLLSQLNHGAKLSMLVNAAWTLSNLCRGKPQPPFDQVSAALPALAQLIRLDDNELLAYTCWALVYLSDGSNEKVQAVIEAKICARLIGLSVHRSPLVLIPALRTIGNIVTGNDSQTQHIIDLQALPCLLNLLRGSYNKTIRKEACWAVSNITAGCQSQIQAVIDAGICPALVNLLQNSELNVKNEAAWAICNAIAGGSYKQIMFLVKQECIKPLCDRLTSSDTQLVMVCLEALEKILKVGEVFSTRNAKGIYQCPQTNVNPHAQLIEEAEGLEKIEGLQSHENNEIYETSVKILETYWTEEEEEEGVQGKQDMIYVPLDNFANMPTPSGTLSEMYCGP
ncbi:PREDICTED: importin subunit alpha-7-like isoform X1 [Camelina sativa]|uniref:Importin subunit alpha n=2 Tax=Camelina sativa TaxID=90675 RepID=A0ABM0TTG5_CAMSA|nr:PREDICTED: importin subunit alpha-7-like isoform X1 [Camelina sativa]